MELQRFISFLLSLEPFSFVNILYFNTNPELEVHQNTTDLPRIVFHLTPNTSDSEIGSIYSENLVYEVIPFQKLLFNSNIFSTIFVQNGTLFDEQYLAILNFQEDSKILVIFEDVVDFDVASIMIEAGLLNFIFVSVQDFKETQEFFTFEVFPNVTTITNKYMPSLANPYLNHLQNLHGHNFEVLCPNDIPNCMYPEGDNYDYGGIMLRVILDFSQFTNCDLSIYYPHYMKAGGFDDFASYDIYGMTVFIPYMSFEDNFIYFQQSCYPLDFLYMFVVVPSPQPIHTSLYPFKPFSLEIWFAIAAVILYSTLLIKLSNSENIETGDYFTRILRLAFAQSISFKHDHPVLSLFYVLNSLFGFVITLWYGAILGSFMSTYLNEKPIQSFEDLSERQMEIIYPDLGDYNASFDYMPLITENRDLFSPYPSEQFANLLNTMDTEFAYLEDSSHWNYFIAPQIMYYSDPKLMSMNLVLGTSFSNIHFKFKSVFKKQFNRVVFLLKDVGLYNHYAKSVFYHNLKYDFVNHTTVDPVSKVHVLTTTYFSNVFVGWSFGLGLALIVFCIEIVFNVCWRK